MKCKILLKDWMKDSPITINDFLKISILLTEMVMNYHKKNETIGILTPENIMIHEDLKLATVIGTSKWNATYRAPEYSGKINRSPDGRTDLYSLGVILYEIIAGQPPYQLLSNDDDWALVHMSIVPPPLSDFRPELEGPIEEIIMKLLAKSPDARYQTAWGLLEDLKSCSANQQQYGKMISFEIGRMDEMTQFRYPEELINRKQEFSLLESAFKRASTGDSVVMVSVSGVEGTGKTALIEQFLNSLTIKGTGVLTGACDIQNRDSLFEPVLQAVRLGLDRLWSESASDIAFMRSLFERELGDEITVLSELMPEAAALMDIPSFSASSPSLDSDRIVKALQAIIRCYSFYNEPLVLFIDNLQWADEGTIDLVHKLSRDTSLFGLMFIGSYRTSDVASKDLTDTALGEPYTGKAVSMKIDLKPLLYNDVRSLLNAMLHDDSMRVRVLAKSLYAQTQGNPAIIRKLLHEWHQDEKLRFNEMQHRWEWELELQQLGDDSLSDALSLYEFGYNRLSDEAKNLLQLAAVIGVKFQSRLLGEVCGYSYQEMLVLLDMAEKEGLVYCEDEPNDRYQNRVYLFMDAQLQSKLLQMLGEDTLREWHYKIGKSIKSGLQGDGVDGTEMVTVAVNHLNLCIDCMTASEQLELAQLNYQASVSSFYRRKFVQATTYIEIGIQLLERLNEPISAQYPYYMHLAYCEYMCGNMEKVHQHMAYLMSHQDQLKIEERIRIALYQLEMLTFENNEEAVKIGRVALSEYGWNLPERVSNWTVLNEVLRTQNALRKHFHISELSENDDPDYELLSRLVITMNVQLLLVDPKLLIVLIARFIRYGLKKGMNQFLLYQIAIYQFILQRGLPFIQKSLPSGVLEKLESASIVNEATEYRLPYTIGMIKQLYDPHETTRYLLKATKRAVECNDATMASLSMITLLVSHHGNVHELEELISYIEEEAKHIMDNKTAEILNVAKIYCASMQMADMQASFIALPSKEEAQKEDSYLCMRKLEVAYFSEQYEAALQWAKRGKALEQSFDWLLNRKIRFFEALSEAALYQDASPSQQQEFAQSIRSLLSKMKKWEGYCGRHSSAYYLIQAEWKRMKGKTQEALKAYEVAINKSKEDHDSIVEAISMERVYDFYSQIGRLSSYAILLVDACTKYSECGINIKVNRIKETHPELRWFDMEGVNLTSSEAEVEVEAELLATKVPFRHEFQQLIEQETDEDLLSQMVNWSGSTGEELLDQFLKTAIRQTGADRGCVLRWEEDACLVDTYFDSTISLREQMKYSAAISRYVRMTRRSVLLDYAPGSRYAGDRYIVRRLPASVICMSMGRAADGNDWQLYLENSHVAGVFAKRDLHILELLITRLNYVNWINQVSSTNGSIDQPTEIISSNAENKYKRAEVERLIEPLTQREQEVLEELVAGYSNKEIANRLGISEATVKTHLFNIYGKLEVKRRSQAIARAKELELI